MQLAQTGDPRVTALEEQVRSLSGTIEELNFQILQMQEQLRKMQEDNEFRFQELEKKKSDAGGKTDRNVAGRRAGRRQPAGRLPRRRPRLAPASKRSSSIREPANRRRRSAGTAAPPKTFGTITFDEKGNVTGGSVGDQISSAPADGRRTAGFAPSKPTTRSSPRCRRPTIRKNSTATPTSSSCPATTARPRPASATTSPASRPTRRPPMRTSGSANRCSARRNTATRPRSSSPPTRNIPRPRRRPTCC